ncbi:MAG: hypothetical protein L0H59_10305 [Tomitella sp.]|nr:hypothetical protein [Tomitella sp.]
MGSWLDDEPGVEDVPRMDDDWQPQPVPDLWGDARSEEESWLEDRTAETTNVEELSESSRTSGSRHRGVFHHRLLPIAAIGALVVVLVVVVVIAVRAVTPADEAPSAGLVASAETAAPSSPPSKGNGGTGGQTCDRPGDRKTPVGTVVAFQHAYYEQRNPAAVNALFAAGGGLEEGELAAALAALPADAGFCVSIGTQQGNTVEATVTQTGSNRTEFAPQIFELHQTGDGTWEIVSLSTSGTEED